MNKKIEACENQEFLPKEVAESEKAQLDTAQKNVLGTLCFYYLNHSIFAAEHDGWFFKDQKTLFEESNLSPAEGKRVLLKLVFKRLIERTSGTNHKCTLYRLNPNIVALLPENPEVKTELFEKDKTANELLVKKRQDESSKDETSQVEREENIASEAALEEAASSQLNVKDVLQQFREDIARATSKNELEELKGKLFNSGISVPPELEEWARGIWNSYHYRHATLKYK